MELVFLPFSLAPTCLYIMGAWSTLYESVNHFVIVSMVTGVLYESTKVSHQFKYFYSWGPRSQLSDQTSIKLECDKKFDVNSQDERGIFAYHN